jgi:thiol:disulfide interchange protein DsbD
LALGLSVVPLILTGGLLTGVSQGEPGGTPIADQAVLPFSEQALASARAAGRPVFVDMTAAWCVTCLVNERVALAPKEVRDAFALHGVAWLRGDWTRRDPAISRYLREAGHQGVPLYVFYPPHSDPVTLPLILSPSIVLAALRSPSQ